MRILLVFIRFFMISKKNDNVYPIKACNQVRRMPGSFRLNSLIILISNVL